MKFTKEEKETKKMTTKGHCMGSDKRHNIRKKRGCSKEWIELARFILCFEKHMQATAEEENQRYGWVMKREVR